MCLIEWIINFSDFYFSSYREKLIENWSTKTTKNDDNSKNKNLKLDFSFEKNIGKKIGIFFCSIIETFLNIEAYPYLGQGPLM